MRRVGNLFPTFYGFGNWLSAYRKARQGSRATTESAEFFQEMEKEIIALQEAFAAGNWQPGPFRYFDIFDPKRRTIAVAPFRDRVVHHALVNVLEPVYERVFIADSFATRKGKGVHAAVRRAQYFLGDHEWFLKTDVEKFFDSIDQEILLNLLARKIKDKQLLAICEKIVRHGGHEGRGLPIGNRTSQFFANVYLDPLDHWLKDRFGLRGYVRYMDDFVLFDNDKHRLKSSRLHIEDFLWEELGLTLKPSATFLQRRCNGLSFLGRRIFPNTIRLRPENLRRITARIALRERQLLQGDLDEIGFLQSMNSYWAMLSFYPELAPLRRALARGG